MTVKMLETLRTILFAVFILYAAIYYAIIDDENAALWRKDKQC